MSIKIEIAKEKCPFCGDKAVAFWSEETQAYHVSCDGEIDEECRGKDEGWNELSGYISMAAAIKAWDKRA